MARYFTPPPTGTAPFDFRIDRQEWYLPVSVFRAMDRPPFVLLSYNAARGTLALVPAKDGGAGTARCQIKGVSARICPSAALGLVRIPPIRPGLVPAEFATGNVLVLDVSNALESVA